jgi:hypothetical protein
LVLTGFDGIGIDGIDGIEYWWYWYWCFGSVGGIGIASTGIGIEVLR